MSKSLDRTKPAYWEGRLFRNTFTYRGERREVAGWCVKIQWQGRRRTFRLESEDRRLAAREVVALHESLRRHGWEGLGAVRARGGGVPSAGERADMPVLAGVSPRKYVSSLNPGRSREYFAELSFRGAREQVALGTEDENEARLRALELRSELATGGWEGVRLGWPLEVTVAVFWQSNPMICTYTTLLTFPAREGGGVPMEARARGWRVLVVEPDGAVRRALVHWLRRSERVALVLGVPMPMVARRAKDWHLVLANHNQPMAALRAFADRAGAGGQPARLLTHGLFRDSDAIFASVSGVARGYFLRRLPPSDLLEPVLGSLPEGPSGEVETDRMVRRYFQECLEPRDGRSEPHPTLLTARETDVLELLRRGLVDKEIAGELGLSVWTVHSHLKRIFAKLGVRTRTEAVVRHLQK